MKTIRIGVLFMAACGGGSFTSLDAELDAGALDAQPAVVVADAGRGAYDAGVFEPEAGAADDGNHEADMGPDAGPGAQEAGTFDAHVPVVDAGDGCTLTTHTNGLGGGWQDCSPLGTYTPDEQLAACKSYGHCSGTCQCGGAELPCSIGAVAYVWGPTGMVATFTAGGACAQVGTWR